MGEQIFPSGGTDSASFLHIHVNVKYKTLLLKVHSFNCSFSPLFLPQNGLPSVTNPYVFNGDFVDRGKNSMEILMILFVSFLVYPNDLHLNRGNHEDFMMNMR